MLGWLLSGASEIAGPVWNAARTFAGTTGRMWSADGRTHFEVKGVHRPENEKAARVLEQRLTARPGVSRAHVNAPLGRVVVGHDSGVISAGEIAEIIAEVELDYHLSEQGVAPMSTTHPGNAGPLLREFGAVVAGFAGLGYSVATIVLPVRPLPPLVPAVTSLVDSVPWLRSSVEARFGRTATDTLLTALGVASQTFAQQPMALATGLCQRVCTAREVLARREAWRRWEETKGDQHAAHRVAPLDVSLRPVPLPEGPVERAANAAGGLGIAGYGTVLAATRQPQRALAALAAAMPSPARAGREGFAAQLASGLSRRANLVFAPDALRRLDRVDTVVLDARILLTGLKRISTVLPTSASADTTVLFEKASALIDLREPRMRSHQGQWSTASLADYTTELPEHIRMSARQQRQRGATVVVLLQDARPVALVCIEAELDPLAEALAEAARTVGSVVLAGAGSHLDRRLYIDRVVRGGNRLHDSVRRLQSEGHVVALVSAQAPSALAAADVGIGLPGESGVPPWGGHVLCTTATEVHLVLSAVANARRASRDGVALSVAGSCAGAVFSTLGPAAGAANRASTPVHAATLFALGAGTWYGMQATQRTPPAARTGTHWHALPVRSVLNLLGSSERGITSAEAQRRRQPEARAADGGVTQATVQALINPMTAVLGAGAAVSASLGSMLDAGMIMFVLGASAVVDGVQRATTDRELERLLKSGELPARLRRDGTVQTVSADQLVPGDVVELHSGDGVPADCRVLTSEGTEVDESSLTGESQLVAKSPQPTGAPAIADRTSMLYQGTVVATGRTTAVVVATGTHTELGSTTRANGVDTGTGGVEARLGELTRRILPASAGAGGVLLLADLLRGTPLGQAVSRAVGLAVAAVPEGLPFVATVAETAAARRLANRGVLVRSPKTIEALGRVDALCFDKTGTLTQGKISLRHVSDGDYSSPMDRLDPWLRQVVITAVRASPAEGDRPLPHPTDRAVVDGAQSAGIASPAASRILADLPFEPARGYHAVRLGGPEGHHVSVKGAPEVVLERCSRWRRPTGTVAFDAQSRRKVGEAVEHLAERGQRVLAVAERAASDRPELDDSDVADLEFVGLLGLADPVHPTAAEAVGRLRHAGIDVMMITGDHPSTAEAIAVDLDMLNGKRVVTGSELDAMDDEQLAAEVPKIAVFARVSPAQKARIVRQLRATDRIVAMTGDGANDVPAIRLAHVGIALGSHATPAARQAADLVITDDRIETIAQAIVEGRGMWASVHDALSILLGGNLGEIVYTLGSGLLGTNAAPNARQLLVVNLLTDVLPALAIAVRPPPGVTAEQLLAEGPEASLGTALNRDVYARAAATAGAAFVAWLVTRPVGTAGQARTAGLVALVAGQLGQTLAMRGRTPLVLGAGVGSVLILVAIVQVPGVSQFFGNQPLLLHQWALALGCAAASTAAVTLWQLWVRNNTPPELE